MDIKKRHTIIETKPNELDRLKRFLGNQPVSFGLGSGIFDGHQGCMSWVGSVEMINSIEEKLYLYDVEEAGEPVVDMFQEDWRLSWTSEYEKISDCDNYIILRTLNEYLPELMEDMKSQDSKIYIVERSTFSPTDDTLEAELKTTGLSSIVWANIKGEEIPEEIIREIVQYKIDENDSADYEDCLIGSNWQRALELKMFEWLLTLDCGLCWEINGIKRLYIEVDSHPGSMSLYYEEDVIRDVLKLRKLKPFVSVEPVS